MKLTLILISNLVLFSSLNSQSISEYNTNLGDYNPKGFEKIGDYYYAGTQVVSDAVIYQMNSDFQLVWTDTIDSFTREDGFVIGDWNYTDLKFEKTDEGVSVIVVCSPGKFNTSSWYVRTLNYTLDGVKLSDSLCYCEENWYSGNAVKFRRKEKNNYYLAWSKSLYPQRTDHNSVARLNSFGEREWVVLLDTNTIPKMHKLDDATVDNDGNLWIVGKMNYDGGGNTPPYLANISKEGIELGRYGTNSDKKFGVFKVSMVNNEPVVIASWRDEYSGYRFGFENKILIFKLENDQIIKTDFLYEEKEYNTVLTTLTTRDGGMIISIGSSNFQKKTPDIDFSSQEAIFFKFNSYLEKEWEIKFDTKGDYVYFSSSFEEQDGVYNFVGKVGNRMTVIKIDDTETTVESQELASDNQLVDVYDMNGLKVLSSIENLTTQMQNLRTGVYFLKPVNITGTSINIRKISIVN